MVKVDPNLYRKLVITDSKGHMILYVKNAKVSYFLVTKLVVLKPSEITSLMISIAMMMPPTYPYITGNLKA